MSLIDPEVVARLSRLSLNARGMVAGSFTGKHCSPHKGASVEFAQYRKYTEGDDIKQLDWRVFARTDRFYVKEFEADTNLRCYLVVDISGSMAFGEKNGSKFNYASRLAAHLAHVLIHQGDSVGLQCFSDGVIEDIPPRNNPRHLSNICNILHAAEPDSETHIVKVLHEVAEKIRRRAMVIIFSDFFTRVAPLLACFGHLRYHKHDLTVFHIMDQEELVFDFDRPVRFHDLESHNAVITEPGLIRSRYLAAVKQHLKELKIGCLEHGVEYRFVRPDMSCEDVLSDYMLNRMSK